MATIVATSLQGSGDRSVTVTTLDGSSDTFTYNASKTPVLQMTNNTAGALQPTLDGDGATTVQVAGVGSVDVSGGFTTASIAIGATLAIPLNSISAYLAGTITITGGTGLEAVLYEN